MLTVSTPALPKPLYRAIQLSGPAQFDQCHNDLTNYFSYRIDINKHARFWLKDPASREQDLNSAMAIISEDLMEKDYSEVRSGGHSGNVIHQGKIAYHQNHGTSHGLRQREYQTQYLELVKQQGTPAFQIAAENLTEEELEIMKLAAYMHRLGRTNERGFKGDPFYGPRSMQLFTQVALDLGFNEQLVGFVAGTMNKFRSVVELQKQNDGDPSADPNYSAFIDIPMGCARQKAILFERLIEAGHQTDLVRCWLPDKYLGLRDNIALRLDGMLQPSCNTKDMASKFLNMAGLLCRTTGAPIGLLPESSRLNPQLVVNSANNVVGTKSTLAKIATDYILSLNILVKPTLKLKAPSTVVEVTSDWEKEKSAINRAFQTFSVNIKSICHEHCYKVQVERMLDQLTEAKERYFEKSKPLTKERDFFINESKIIIQQYKPKIDPVAWESIKDFAITFLNALRFIARCFGADLPRQTLFSENRIEKQNAIETVNEDLVAKISVE